jgi:hypothetical protein
MKHLYKNKYLKYKAKYIKLKNSMILNLIWINTQVCDSNYIFPESYKGIDIIDKIRNWLDLDYKIYFWYDSSSVSTSQLEKTKKFFEYNDIEFFDIITILSDYNEILKCKLYLKVDFFRLVVLKYLMEKQPWFKYYIYSDIIINPLYKDEIIENKILNKFQMVFSDIVKGEFAKGFENGFIIFKNEEILKNNFINFLNKAYQLILVNNKKYFNSLMHNNCKFFGGDKNQIFYSVLKSLVYLQIQQIFYNSNENIEEAIIQSINGGKIDKLFDEKNTSLTSEFDTLPIKIIEKKSKPFSNKFLIRQLIREIENLKEDPIKNKSEIEKKENEKLSLEKIEYKEVIYNYLYPVIQVKRLAASGKYDK